MNLARPSTSAHPNSKETNMLNRTLLLAGYEAASVGMFATSVLVSASRSADFLSLMYELTDNLHLVVLLNFVVAMFVLFGVLTVRFFFTEIRLSEIEHLTEELPFYGINLLIILFSDENLLLNILWINLTLLSKVFHVLLVDRLDAFEMKLFNSIPDRLSSAKQVFWAFASYRVVHLLAVFTVSDLVCAKFLAYDVFQGTGSVGSLLFGIHHVVLGMEALAYFGKLLLNAYELMFYKVASRSVDDEDDDAGEVVWENKPIFAGLFDIFVSAAKVVLFMTFMYVLYVHGNLSPPITILQGTAVSVHQLVTKVSKFRSFLQHSRKLEKHLANASRSDLDQADSLCIICREDMYEPEEYSEKKHRPMPPRKFPKKLRCGHILHMGCLKDWLERSDNCPLCRKTVFAKPHEPQTPPPPAQPQNQPQMPPQPTQQASPSPTPTPTSPDFHVPASAFIPPDWCALPVAPGDTPNSYRLRISPTESASISVRSRVPGRAQLFTFAHE